MGVSQQHDQYSLPNTEPSMLENIGRVKAGTLKQIVPAFLSDMTNLNHIKTATKLVSCSEYANENSGDTFTRCRLRICPVCSLIKANQWKKKITKATELMNVELIDDDLDNRDAGIKVTLNAGQACNIDDLPIVIKLLHKVWPRLLRATHIKPYVIGSIRATEITVTNSGEGITANPHIHGTIMIRIPENEKIDKVIEHTTSSIINYWKRAIRTQLKKAGLESKIYSAAQQAEPLREQHKTDFIEWTEYCTKGAIQNLAHQLRSSVSIDALPNLSTIWATVNDALKNIRLISSSGVISEALQAVKSAKQKSDKRPPIDPKPPTHRYSYSKKKYIPIQDWIREEDKPQNLLLGYLAHLYPPQPLESVSAQILQRDLIPDEERARHYLSTTELKPQFRDHKHR